ncbi:hypothetical protein Hanom_Chr01g00041031 [Helianthus anomalus]
MFNRRLEDFPMFAELFSTHNEDMMRRKVEEKIRDEGIPTTMSKEDLREARKNWFRPMPKKESIKGHLLSLLDILINRWAIFFREGIWMT